MRILAGAFAATTLLLASGIACADTIGRGVGPGTTCAEYAKMYQGNPKEAEMTFFSWAQGFMAGWNTARLRANQSTVDMDKWSQDDQRQFVRNFCDAHPLQEYFGAVLALYRQMADEQKNKL